VLHVLQQQDNLGTGFVMARVEGETIPRKILRDEKFAQARPILARQLGKVLAGIHRLALAQLPELRRMTAAREIDEVERDYRSFDWPRPVLELALRLSAGPPPPLHASALPSARTPRVGGVVLHRARAVAPAAF
jgi:hypothetical protein